MAKQSVLKALKVKTDIQGVEYPNRKDYLAVAKRMAEKLTKARSSGEGIST